MRTVLQKGFTMKEYSQFQIIVEDHRYYSSIYFDDPGRVTFEQALDDTLKKWGFITDWVARWNSKSVKVLKERVEAARITEVINLDEPLCFEDLICNKTQQRCACCPLWHLTGHPCERPKSIKYNVIKSWHTGDGYFYPHLFAGILRKIKYGNPLYSYDLEFFTGVW